MKYYFGYDANGILISTEATTGGFSDDHRLDNPDCGHPLVDFHRSLRKERNPEVRNFIGYDCPCDGTKIKECGCLCVSKKRLTGRVVDGKLIDKPVPVLILDNQVTDTTKLIVRTPNQKILLSFSVPQEANGSNITVSSGKTGAQLSLDLPKDLLVSKGITTGIELTIPSQGMRGGLYVSGPWISPLEVNFIGFTT